MKFRIISVNLAMLVIQVFGVDYKSISADLSVRATQSLANINILRQSLSSTLKGLDSERLSLVSSDGSLPLQDKLNSLKQSKDFSRCSSGYDLSIQSLNKVLQTTVKTKITEHDQRLARIEQNLTEIKNVLNSPQLSSEVEKCGDPKQSCQLTQNFSEKIKNAENIFTVQRQFLTPPGLPQRIITQLDPMHRAQIIQQSIIDPVNNCLSHAPK